VLAKIPVLPSLLHSSQASSLDITDGISLLDWINAQDNKNSLQDIVIQCRNALVQFDGTALETVMREVLQVGVVDDDDDDDDDDEDDDEDDEIQCSTVKPFQVQIKPFSSQVQEALNNSSMKEIKGLDERLLRLQELLQRVQELVQSQAEMAQVRS